MKIRFQIIERVKQASRLHAGVRIVQTRLIVSLATLLLAAFTPAFTNPAQVALGICGYVTCISLIGLLPVTTLERKRVRAIPLLFDLALISFLVASSGDFESSWFLLYLFPIMSVSRYLSPKSSVMVAILSIIAYAIASNAFARGTPETFSFGFRALILIGIALTAASLARAMDRMEANLVAAMEKIDREILNNADGEKIMQTALDTAMEITGSDFGVTLRSSGKEITDTFSVARKTMSEPSGILEREANEAIRFAQDHRNRILGSRKVLALPESWALIAAFTGLFSKSKPACRSAILVPLEMDGDPAGVLGVFSRRSLHYTPNDQRRLLSLAPLVAIAQKNAKLYKELAARDQESKERLQSLHDMSEHLKSEQRLDKVFFDVVKLVSVRLHSEEAALFIPEDNGGRLVKVAVAGPDKNTTARLMEIERSYENDWCLTRRVFVSKKPLIDNSISAEEKNAMEYSGLLPSGTTKHYLGAPVIIGDEVLGVIRVLNRKGDDYSALSGFAKLAEKGFSSDDCDLLATIAVKVAAGIRSAQFVERNRFFENLVDNSPDPIIVLDKAGRIQKFNHECERLWGLKESAVLGKPVQQFYESPEAAKEIGAALKKADEHKIKDYYARIRDGQGNLIPIRLAATLFLDDEGQILGSIGVFKDEREMIRLEEEKMQAEKLAAIGRLAHTAGHDIKTDLGTVLNWIEILEYGELDSDMREACAAIREACNDARGKLQNMLMTAKPKPPQKQIISLNSIISGFKAGSASRMSAANIQFSVNFPECDLLIYADPDQLRQVCSNLLSNSVDAIKLARLVGEPHLAGKIDLTVEVKQDEGSVLLFWRDDGHGMSDKVKTKAFAPLFTTKQTGSGLGLFIIKAIIENHGGSISLESLNGKGVCFRIVLPLLSGPAKPQEIDSGSNAVSGEERS